MSVRINPDGYAALSDVSVLTLKKNMAPIVGIPPPDQSVCIRMDSGAEIALEDKAFIPLEAVLVIYSNSFASSNNVRQQQDEYAESTSSSSVRPQHYDVNAGAHHFSLDGDGAVDGKTKRRHSLSPPMPSPPPQKDVNAIISNERPPLAGKPSTPAASVHATEEQQQLLAAARSIFHKESPLAFSPARSSVLLASASQLQKRHHDTSGRSDDTSKAFDSSRQPLSLLGAAEHHPDTVRATLPSTGARVPSAQRGEYSRERKREDHQNMDPVCYSDSSGGQHPIGLIASASLVGVGQQPPLSQQSSVGNNALSVTYSELLAVKSQLDCEVAALRKEQQQWLASQREYERQQVPPAPIESVPTYSSHSAKSMLLPQATSSNGVLGSPASSELLFSTKAKVTAMRAASQEEEANWASVKQALESQIVSKKAARMRELEKALCEEKNVVQDLLHALDSAVYQRERLQSVLAEVDRQADAEKGRVDAASRDLDALREDLHQLLRQCPMPPSAAPPEMEKKDAELALFIASSAAQKHKQVLTTSSLARRREALAAELRALSDQRRTLHNDVEEAKGNIRVVVRMRPKLPEEESTAAFNSGGARLSTTAPLIAGGLLEEGILEVDETTHTVTAITPTSGTRQFEFFAVYGPPPTTTATAAGGDGSIAQQGEIFHEQIVPLLHSAFDGFNVSVLAYGQTGSGKTFTILGETRDGQLSGLLPQAVEFVLDHMSTVSAAGGSASPTSSSQQQQQHRRRVTLVSMSIVELYLDVLYDLLSVVINGVPKRCEISMSSGSDSGGGPAVIGATEVELTDWTSAMHYIQQAVKVRQTHKTLRNAKSSRSFLVITLNVATVSLSGQVASSKLLFVDLAGSERVSRSLSDGDRLREAQHINKSLAAVGDVMSALSTTPRPVHIPYRNSKLTQLLQNALGGKSKTLLVTCICPHIPWQHNLVETLSTLQFASRTKLVRNVVAKRQQKSNNSSTQPRSAGSSVHVAPGPAPPSTAAPRVAPSSMSSSHGVPTVSVRVTELSPAKNSSAAAVSGWQAAQWGPKELLPSSSAEGQLTHGRAQSFSC